MVRGKGRCPQTKKTLSRQGKNDGEGVRVGVEKMAREGEGHKVGLLETYPLQPFKYLIGAGLKKGRLKAQK